MNPLILQAFLGKIPSTFCLKRSVDSGLLASDGSTD
jgi:hypothetical protein